MSGNPYQTPQHGSYKPPPASLNPVLGIVSLVTGIISLIPGCCCGIIGLPMSLAAIGTGIAGIVMANQGKMGGKGMAIAGLILGGIYMMVFILLLALQLTGAIAPDLWEKQLREMQQQ